MTDIVEVSLTLKESFALVGTFTAQQNLEKTRALVTTLRALRTKV